VEASEYHRRLEGLNGTSLVLLVRPQVVSKCAWHVRSREIARYGRIKGARVGIGVRRRSFWTQFFSVFGPGRRAIYDSGNSCRPFCRIHPLP
jgi:hypothetical protein